MRKLWLEGLLMAWGVACFAMLLLGLAVGGSRRVAEPQSAAGCAVSPVWSLAAVGDTGTPYGPGLGLAAPLVVGRALAEEDASRPLDRLVLLGDNFYPHGLRSESVEGQVRDSVVRPFCRFADPRSLLFDRVAEGCEPDPEARRTIPIDVLLGNHDLQSSRSADLQRQVVPLYVQNWRVAEPVVDVVELDVGVSLIFIDSEALIEDLARGRANPAPLVEGLRRSRGPWRVVAAHRPMAMLPDQRFSRFLSKVFAAAAVPVHVFLSGHEHNLLVIARPAPAPALHLVAGSGSSIRPVGRWGQLFGRASLGFARLDLDRSGPEEELVASLHGTSVVASFLRLPPERLGCWRVTLGGRLVGGTGHMSGVERAGRRSSRK